MTNVRLLVVFALASAAACSKHGAASTSTFTPEQRAQIVQTVREAMKRDPSILRDAIIVVQADNERLEAQAQRTALASHRDTLYAAGDPSVGNPRGATTIVEFYDPRCPYCKQLAPQLATFVARDGNVRLVYKDLPILGPPSELASRALLAAARQGRYEVLRAALMQRSSDELTDATLRDCAERLGIDWPRLRRDMGSADVAKQLAANRELAVDLGVEGTPTLVIGQKIVEGADIPTIAAAVANARHDRSLDRTKIEAPISRAPSS